MARGSLIMYVLMRRKRSTNEFVCNSNMFDPIAIGSNLVPLRGQCWKTKCVDRYAQCIEAYRQRIRGVAETSPSEGNRGNWVSSPSYKIIDHWSHRWSPLRSCQRTEEECHVFKRSSAVDEHTEAGAGWSRCGDQEIPVRSVAFLSSAISLR